MSHSGWHDLHDCDDIVLSRDECPSSKIETNNAPWARTFIPPSLADVCYLV